MSVHPFTYTLIFLPGENVFGEGNIFLLVKIGHPRHPGGAIIQKNTKQHGLIADSVPPGELSAYHMATKHGIWCRHMLERFAGIVPNGSTDFVVPNSAPPTWVGIDSGSVHSLLSNETGSGKGMRSYNRIIHFCRSLTREGIFEPVAISSEEQLADVGTKQFRSPTTYWRTVSGALGNHHAILDIQERVRQAHGRSNKKRPLNDDKDRDNKQKVSIFSLNVSDCLETDEETVNKLLGKLTMDNTRANAERDDKYRQQIEDSVHSGNGHLIAQGFATSQEELTFVIQTQEDLTHKLSLVRNKSTRQPR